MRPNDLSSCVGGCQAFKRDTVRGVEWEEGKRGCVSVQGPWSHRSVTHKVLKVVVLGLGASLDEEALHRLKGELVRGLEEARRREGTAVLSVGHSREVRVGVDLRYLEGGDEDHCCWELKKG